MSNIIDPEWLYVNSFQVGAIMVFNTLFDVALENGEMKTLKIPEPRHDIVIKIDIKGNISGYVIYSFGFTLASRIAEALVPGISEEDVRNEYRDIMGELANMLTGNSLNVLSKSGLDISTPLVMHRDELEKPGSSKYQVMVFDQHSPLGEIETTVVLENK